MGLPLDIIFENDEFIAINKPAGLLSIPNRDQSEMSLKDMLLEHYGSIYTVHRLDQFTSGVIVFAKNESTHKFISQAFENRETEKFYVGIVLGKVANDAGVVNEPIRESTTRNGYMIIHHNGKESITEYKVQQRFNGYTFMRYKILTGRTHQIRVHSKFIGNPIVCDDLYGDGKPFLLSNIKRKKFKMSKYELEEKPLLNRIALHAQQLSFTDAHGRQHTLIAELPKDLRATLNQLEKWATVGY
jgi:23S rRNA pseudouridine1911/1915/1917 synthase